MRSILEAQRTRIAATAAEYDQPQAFLPFDTAELKQLEANKRHWTRRLAELAVEIDSEPARILASYDVKATRFEPVGLVYLWPVTG